MFRTLLIANRGEIACRIIRTARRLGIRTIAVYSDADSAAQHVRQADSAVRIGPAPALQSYLDIDAVLAAAAGTHADAIHPGYGFLSENADFAAACAQAGRVFVGPSADVIRAMGSKIEAKRRVAAAGTPVVPGYHGSDQDDATLLEAAHAIGFPLLIKASAGGGGKGMRQVDRSDAFVDALQGARREAQRAFGDDRVLLERYLQVPKHLEVQILADRHGRTLHLFERDCSVQRRHQKVIEEAPGPTVTDALRERLGSAAVTAAAAVGYVGAGTIEFIAEGEEFYFMEMNTRLQVEHPVTEAITGLDLVEWQLRIAAGEPLTLTQDAVHRRGHAIEARIYAENPRRGFLPSTGELALVSFPDGVRIDSGVATGARVGVHYDPMLAKVIAHGDCRNAALEALDTALAATGIAGVEHNVAFLRQVLAHPEFRAGLCSTQFLDAALDGLVPPRDPAGAVCAALALQHDAAAPGPWGATDGFRANLPGGFEQTLLCDGDPLRVRVDASAAWIGERRFVLQDVRRDAHQIAFRLDEQVVRARIARAPGTVFVMREGDTETFGVPRLDLDALAAAVVAGGRIRSPMPGQVIAVRVGPGDAVQPGTVLLVIEAMKMEHSVVADGVGIVASVACRVGDRVEDGAELVVLEPPAAPDAGPP